VRWKKVAGGARMLRSCGLRRTGWPGRARIVAEHGRVVGDVGVAREGAEVKAPLGVGVMARGLAH